MRRHHGAREHGGLVEYNLHLGMSIALVITNLHAFSTNTSLQAKRLAK